MNGTNVPFLPFVEQDRLSRLQSFAAFENNNWVRRPHYGTFLPLDCNADKILIYSVITFPLTEPAGLNQYGETNSDMQMRSALSNL